MHRIPLNEFYHRANEKGLIINERARLELLIRPLGAKGVSVALCPLIGYNLNSDAIDAKERHVYGSVVLFNRLQADECEQIIAETAQRFSGAQAATLAAAKALLSRDDLISIYYDQRIMEHPVMLRASGPVKMGHYGGGGSSIGDSDWRAIARAAAAINNSCALEQDLYRATNYEWYRQEGAQNTPAGSF